MTDNSTAYEGTVIGTMAGLFANYIALIPPFPGWLTQALVTVSVGAISVMANRFVTRFMDRRWPNRKRRKGDSRDTGD